MELLAVISIIVIVMSISVAGLMGTKRNTGLLGAAELVADLSRQARVTALATGAPVQLIIDPNQRTISGIAQTPVLHCSFDQGTPAGLPIGSGEGIGDRGWTMRHSDPIIYPSDFDYSNGNDDGVIQNAELLTIPLEFSKPLLRKQGDGFFISCWVQPPLVTTGPSIIPLVVIGGNGNNRWAESSASSPSETPAVAGFGLMRESLALQNAGSRAASINHWLLVAWIQTGTGTSDYRRIIGVTEGGAYHASVLTPIVHRPITGDEWINLGIHYDGDNLTFYRDGVEMPAKLDDGLAPTTPLPNLPNLAFNKDLECSVGHATQIGSGSLLIGHGFIDDLRILRLGTDRPQVLPSGVSPAAFYRIRSANGTTKVFSRASASVPWSVVEEIRLTNAGDGKQATITIKSDGSPSVKY